MNCKELTINDLVKVCRTLYNIDSYSVSPVYYLMTGRKGGMIFEEDNKIIIAVNHPNLDDYYLVFPNIIGIINTDLSKEIEVAKMLMNQTPRKKVIIARVPNNIAENYSHLIVEENFMDWKYPVHILDVAKVVARRGKNYQQIRQRLNQLDIKKCFTKELDAVRDFDVVLKMTTNWAKAFPYGYYSTEDLISPTKKLLELMKDSRLSICGHIIYFDGTPSAYCLWEEQGDIANGYAMSANKNIHGLAEYNIVEMCRYLQNKKITKVNIGGSESEGLNRYKKKFSPIQSLNLKSCVVK